MQTLILFFLIIAFIYFLLREHKNNLAEESFLAVVNHTFRTPLTRIKWQSDSVSPDQPREVQLETARNISAEIDKILEIIDMLSGIKDVHNRASYDMKAVSMREIIEKSVGKYRAMISEKNITFRMPTFIDTPLLTVDTKKISFVIDALIANAVFYSKQNGSIEIESRIVGNKLSISIKDSGIGLSWKDKRNLYGRFYRGTRAVTMNTDGMGLSLYLSKEIIRRHKGHIDAHSKGKDRGSTFSITLPISRQK